MRSQGTKKQASVSTKNNKLNQVSPLVHPAIRPFLWLPGSFSLAGQRGQGRRGRGGAGRGAKGTEEGGGVRSEERGPGAQRRYDRFGWSGLGCCCFCRVCVCVFADLFFACFFDFGVVSFLIFLLWLMAVRVPRKRGDPGISWYSAMGSG